MAVASTGVSRRDFLRMRLYSPGVNEQRFGPFMLSEDCLTTQNVYCRSCGDACPVRAIRFTPLPGGKAEMKIDEASCDSCEACAEVCPTGALSLINKSRGGESNHA